MGLGFKNKEEKREIMPRLAAVPWVPGPIVIILLEKRVPYHSSLKKQPVLTLMCFFIQMSTRENRPA